MTPSAQRAQQAIQSVRVSVDRFSAPRILGTVGDSALGKHLLRRIMGKCANVMSIYCET